MTTEGIRHRKTESSRSGVKHKLDLNCGRCGWTERDIEINLPHNETT